GIILNGTLYLSMFLAAAVGCYFVGRAIRLKQTRSRIPPLYFLYTLVPITTAFLIDTLPLNNINASRDNLLISSTPGLAIANEPELLLIVLAVLLGYAHARATIFKTKKQIKDVRYAQIALYFVLFMFGLALLTLIHDIVKYS